MQGRLCLVLFLTGCFLACPGDGRAGEIRMPVLILASQVESCPGCGHFLREDRSWMAGLPPRNLVFIALDSLVADSPDSLLLHPRQLAQLVRPVRNGPGAGRAGRPLTALLRDRWLARGYLEVRVDHRPGTGQDPDTLIANPGGRWTLAGLSVGGEDFPEREALLKEILPHPGRAFSAAEISDALRRLLKALGARGYPFPRWVTRSVELDPVTRQVSLAGALLPGRPAVIGPVTSDLASGPGRNFLVRATGLKPGMLPTPGALALAVQRLEARDLYARVEQPRVYLTGSPDTVGIHFPVLARRKINRLAVVLGLSRSNATGPSRLSGQVDLDLPNMAGTGRGLQAGWRDDGSGTSRFGFHYREPLVFGTPLDMQLGMASEVRRESYTRFELSSHWELPVVALWGVGVEVGWDRATYPAGDLERTTRLKAGGSVLHKRGDRYRSGWRGSFGITSAWGSTIERDAEGDSLVTERLGRSTSVRIYTVDVLGEIRLGPNLGLVGRGSYRQQTGGEPVVPLAEQFWFGGANTLRGYNEREFHGSKAAWGGVELRVGRVRSSRLYTFWDLGYFTFETPDTGAPTLLRTVSGRPRGYGLGLLARTRGGDLSLAIGFPGTMDFDLAKLHVTMLEAF